MHTVEICDKAVDALENGDFLVTEVRGVTIKISKYAIDEQITDSTESQELVFMPHITKRRQSDAP